MKLGQRGFCVDKNGHLRWSWEYWDPELIPDHTPPTRIEIDAEGVATERILFDPQDLTVTLDESDFAPGEISWIAAEHEKVKIKYENQQLEILELYEDETGTMQERPHRVQLNRAARRPKLRAARAVEAFLRGFGPQEDS